MLKEKEIAHSSNNDCQHFDDFLSYFYFSTKNVKIFLKQEEHKLLSKKKIRTVEISENHFLNEGYTLSWMSSNFCICQ